MKTLEKKLDEHKQPLPTQEEWKTAVHFFSTSKGATKLNENELNLQHSFIKINGKIFCLLNHCLGRGGSATVNLATDQYGNNYAIRIILIPDNEQKENEENSHRIAFDTGIAQKEYCFIEKEHNSGVLQCYSVQKYLVGENLKEYLTRHTELRIEEKIELAIKIAKKIESLHSGKLSKTKTKYAHLDIKPENFMVDLNRNVDLIDFGDAEKLNTETSGSQSVPTRKGTRQYISIDYLSAKNYEKDIFALLRTLYLPENMISNQLGFSFRVINPEEKENLKCIFTEHDVEELQLKDFLDTTDGKVKKNLTITDLISRLKKALSEIENLTGSNEIEKIIKLLNKLEEHKKKLKGTYKKDPLDKFISNIQTLLKKFTEEFTEELTEELKKTIDDNIQLIPILEKPRTKIPLFSQHATSGSLAKEINTLLQKIQSLQSPSSRTSRESRLI